MGKILNGIKYLLVHKQKPAVELKDINGRIIGYKKEDKFKGYVRPVGKKEYKLFN